MKMTELLEKDKEKLLKELENAGTPDKAVPVLEKEADRILYQYNEESRSEADRELSARLMEAVRMAALFADSSSGAEVWEEKTGKEKTGSSGRGSLLCLAISLAALVICLLLEFTASSLPGFLKGGGVRALLMVIAAAAAFLAGTLRRKKTAAASSGQIRTEVLADPGKLYRAFRAVLLTVDQTLERQAAAEEWQKRTPAETAALPVSQEELELVSGLLEASYSDNGQFALQKLGELKYYLYRLQIEIVDYSDETKNWFDLMPGEQQETIRPALTWQGQLVRKGLAAGGM